MSEPNAGGEVFFRKCECRCFAREMEIMVASVKSLLISYTRLTSAFYHGSTPLRLYP
jgi:hypothetical protein